MATIQRIPAGAGGNARGAAVNFAVGAPRTDVGGDIAAAAATIAGTIQKNNLARDGVRSVEVEGSYTRAVEARINDLNPLDADYEASVSAITEEEKQTALSNADLQTTAGKRDLERRLTVLSEGNKTIASRTREDKLTAEALRVREQEVDVTLSKIRNDPDGFDAYIAEFGSKAERLGVNIPPEEQRALAELFGDRAVAAAAEGLALRGDFQQANAFVDAHSEVLDQKTFRNLKTRVREIENRAVQEHRADTAAEIADLSVSITDADTVSGLNALRSDIEARREQGLFTGQEQSFATLVNRIETKKKAVVKANKDLNAGLAKYESGTGVDDQKEADAVWGLIENKLPEETTPDQLIEQVGQFAARSGWLPTEYKRLVENAERTDNPALVAAAAKLHDDVKAVAPDVETGILPEADSRVQMVSAMTSLLGIGYQDAADIMLARVPDAATKKEREAQFEEEFDDFDARELLDSEDIFDDPENVPAAAAADFEEMLRLNYTLVGDRDLALAAASRRFMQVYGNTNVGEQTRVVKFPPERFFPGNANTLLDPEAKRDILNADIERQMAELEIVPALVAPERRQFGTLTDARTGQTTEIVQDASGIAEFILEPDRQTERDLAAGNPPSYRLLVRNSFGLHVPQTAVVRQPDGSQRSIDIRYTMPSLEQLEGIPEYQKLVQEGIEDFELGQPQPGSPFTSPALNRMRRAFPFRLPEGE